jgi:hypothetical protein
VGIERVNNFGHCAAYDRLIRGMQEMSHRKYITWLLTATILLTTYNISNADDRQSRINSDSIQLTSLVRNLYKWHATKYSNRDFPLKFSNPSDSIFTGIDWNAYALHIETLKKTNFFSPDFFSNHRAIALSIDSSIKQAGIEWRNINDGIPLWDTDADEWCRCQDYPDNYWSIITLTDFKFGKDDVSFNWTWKGNANKVPPNKYAAKAKRENGIWKISYLEGFCSKSYGTVSDYNKIMDPNKR